MIAHDERQKSIKPSSKIDNVAFQTSAPSGSSYDTQFENTAFAAQHHNNFKSKQRPLCTYCGLLGHIVQKCYKLHGYPPGHKLHGQESSQQNMPRGQNNYAPKNNSQTQSRSTQSNLQQRSSRLFITFFEAEKEKGDFESSWKIRFYCSSGTVHRYVHRYCSRLLFTVLFIGTVHPRFGTVHRLSFFLQFQSIVKESTQGLMIGRGTLIQNLYILQPSTSSNFCGSLLVDGALWHQRLGHPSFAKLQHISDHIIDAPPSDLLPALSHDSVPLPDASPHTHSSASHSNATPISLETVSRGTGQSRLLNVRPKRTARAPGYLSEYHCAQISSSSSEIPSTTVYPLSSVFAYSALKPISDLCSLIFP
ncbi:unnamed protein product [Microthlaspi erraticum]|uniref:GAG-pre-integrase domain-containing protein n=1 Tax=Microthlaspi erraticum TaxID=1685480 RepID=A0A6D2L3Z8_9BRAS|nr:unnamed protein product [Microthlaspi erraticum]